MIDSNIELPGILFLDDLFEIDLYLRGTERREGQSLDISVRRFGTSEQGSIFFVILECI